MYDLLRWILGLVVTVIAILFAIANRASVALVWSPVNDPVNLPLCAPVLIGVAAGFLLGGAFVWLAAGSQRSEHRQHKKKIGELERQLETVPKISHDKA